MECADMEYADMEYADMEITDSTERLCSKHSAANAEDNKAGCSGGGGIGGGGGGIAENSQHTPLVFNDTKPASLA